jgi:hypothetical protein
VHHGFQVPLNVLYYSQNEVTRTTPIFTGNDVSWVYFDLQNFGDIFYHGCHGNIFFFAIFCEKFKNHFSPKFREKGVSKVLKIKVYSTNIISCKYWSNIYKNFNYRAKKQKMLNFVTFLQNNSAYRYLVYTIQHGKEF